MALLQPFRITGHHLSCLGPITTWQRTPYAQDASPAVKATVIQPDVVRQQKLQIVDGRFVDYRWVQGRWVLSEFANGKGDMDYAAWEKVSSELGSPSLGALRLIVCSCCGP